MTDKPIIFSAPMVRALLDGRKTQTRRVLKPQWVRSAREQGFTEEVWGKAILDRLYIGSHADGSETAQSLPYAIGDRLWVKETWRAERAQDFQSATDIAAACLDAGYSRVWCPTFYEADARMVNFENGMVAGRYRHARFMPRWASRLTLTITDVRVQRVQDIRRDDLLAEGAPVLPEYDGGCLGNFNEIISPREWFRRLWNSIHGPDAWAANPWVVALTFTVRHGNIDRG